MATMARAQVITEVVDETTSLLPSSVHQGISNVEQGTPVLESGIENVGMQLRNAETPFQLGLIRAVFPVLLLGMDPFLVPMTSRLS